MIEGDFVLKGVEQFGRWSQKKDFRYDNYLVLLIQEQLVLVVLVEKKEGVIGGSLKRIEVVFNELGELL
jgi:hypothetical protein